jgi:hypothetical protein
VKLWDIKQTNADYCISCYGTTKRNFGAVKGRDANKNLKIAGNR